MAGETTRRGYGTAHQRTRAHWRPIVAAGGVRCWRCLDPIEPGSTWHLGHDDARRTKGPEHARCNLVAAAEKTNGRATGQPLTSEEW